MGSTAQEDGDVPSAQDGSIDPSNEATAAQRSKKEQRRLAKVQYRMQQKAARAEAVANGDDTSAFRQRKRRSQRDCNRQGALNQRLLAASVDSDTPGHAPSKQRSTQHTPQVTYISCTSRTCDSSSACCLRVVAPYIHRFETFAKARWCGRTLRDVFSGDFAGLPADYCPRAIAAGLIRINGERHDAAYVIRNGDMLTHTVHRHEPPVHLPVSTAITAAAQALVQYETDDVVVVNKPSSLPVHPSGAYLHNSMTEVLETECSVPELFPVHRLDRLTSGLLLFAKSSAKARELCDAIASGDVQKHYVARVVGAFPPATREDDERVDLPPVDFSHVDLSDIAQLARVELNGAMYWKLSAPIGCISSAAHRQGVTRDGNSKDAVTLFRQLSIDGVHSVVECLPITGRTHQIRVHLQFLGFPIANDPEYGPERVATEATTTASHTDQSEDHTVDRTGETQDAVRVDISTPEPSDGVTDEPALCRAICPACRGGDDSIFSTTQRQVFTLWLHSFKYASSKWAFEVPLPQWAHLAT